MEYRRIGIAGQTFSIGLEVEFWECLEDIAAESEVPTEVLAAQVAEQYPENIVSALRVYVLHHVASKPFMNGLTAGLPACEFFSKYH